MLHRIPHRLFDSFGEVFLGRQQIVLFGNHSTISQPAANDERRKQFGQFRLPRATHVLEEFGPRLQPCRGDDVEQPGAEIDEVERLHAAVAIRHHVLGPIRRFVEHRFQVRAQLGEDRDNAGFAARVVGRLGAVHLHAAVFPVNIPPA
ncbi:MAG: hypothetical protein WCB27_19470 [Thermoguttaceae bacterium]